MVGGVDSVEARKLILPKPPFKSSISLPSSSSSSPHFTSFQFDPNSLSLALFHSDSSFSLYPSVSLLSLSSSTLPPPQIVVAPPNSAAAFLLLRDPNPNSLFVVSSPLSGGSAVLLRFYVFNPARRSFVRARVVCNHSDLNFDEGKAGVVFRVCHGVSMKLVADINVFALYSISNSKIWVFAVKCLGDDEVKLMKCAVIDCPVPVFSISISCGFLILGEDNGVRVFPLRPLVKGRVRKERSVIKKGLNCGLENDKTETKMMSLQNGMVHGINGINDNICSVDGAGKLTCIETESKLGVPPNEILDERIVKHTESVKLRSVRLRMDSRERASNFIAFKNNDNNFELMKMPKAISIQALSSTKFMILDSVGNLHLLLRADSVHGSETPYHMKQLTHSMKVRKLVVLPDSSTRAQSVWISDALHTVHMMAMMDMDASVNQSDRKGHEEKLVHTSVSQAIFSSEKIQDVAALAANAILLLGQGSMFAYAIS